MNILLMLLIICFSLIPNLISSQNIDPKSKIYIQSFKNLVNHKTDANAKNLNEHLIIALTHNKCFKIVNDRSKSDWILKCSYQKTPTSGLTTINIKLQNDSTIIPIDPKNFDWDDDNLSKVMEDLVKKICSKKQKSDIHTIKRSSTNKKKSQTINIIITVRDSKKNSRISGAIISSTSLPEDYTTSDSGKCTIRNIKLGDDGEKKINFTILHDSYERFEDNKNITEKNNKFTFYLKPIEKEYYYFRGRIIDEENRKGIDSAIINVYGDDSNYLGKTLTNEIGRYQIKVEKEIIKKNIITRFDIQVKKDNYKDKLDSVRFDPKKNVFDIPVKSLEKDHGLIQDTTTHGEDIFKYQSTFYFNGKSIYTFMDSTKSDSIYASEILTNAKITITHFQLIPYTLNSDFGNPSFKLKKNNLNITNILLDRKWIHNEYLRYLSFSFGLTYSLSLYETYKNDFDKYKNEEWYISLPFSTQLLSTIAAEFWGERYELLECINIGVGLIWLGIGIADLITNKDSDKALNFIGGIKREVIKKPPDLPNNNLLKIQIPIMF